MTLSLPELRVLSQAHAVAMRAKCGLVRLPEALALADDALRLLPAECPVHRAAVDFAASARTHGRQPGPLAEAGEALQMAVRRTLWPIPSERSDLNG